MNQVSPELEELLAAECRTGVLPENHVSMPLADADAGVVRSVIERGLDRRQVANLLVYPSLIPSDIRIPTLLRGLTDEHTSESAIDGVLNLETHGLSAGDRERIATILLQIIAADDVRARPASVSLGHIAERTDIAGILHQLEHGETVVRQNLRSILFRLFRAEGVIPFAQAVARSALSAQEQRRYVELFDAYVRSAVMATYEHPPTRLRKSYREQLDRVTPLLVPELVTIAQSIPRPGSRLLSFELNRDWQDLSILFTAENDWSIGDYLETERSLPRVGRLVDDAEYGKAGYEEDVHGARGVIEWFGECWQLAQGTAFPIPVCMEGRFVPDVYDLRDLRWVSHSTIWRSHETF